MATLVSSFHDIAVYDDGTIATPSGTTHVEHCVVRLLDVSIPGDGNSTYLVEAVGISAPDFTHIAESKMTWEKPKARLPKQVSAELPTAAGASLALWVTQWSLNLKSLRDAGLPRSQRAAPGAAFRTYESLVAVDGPLAKTLARYIRTSKVVDGKETKAIYALMALRIVQWYASHLQQELRAILISDIQAIETNGAPVAAVKETRERQQALGQQLGADLQRLDAECAFAQSVEVPLPPEIPHHLVDINSGNTATA